MKNNNIYKYKSKNYFISVLMAIVGIVVLIFGITLLVLLSMGKIHLISLAFIIISILFSVVLECYAFNYYFVVYVTDDGIETRRLGKIIKKIEWNDVVTVCISNKSIGNQYGKSGNWQFIIVSTGDIDVVDVRKINLKLITKRNDSIVIQMDKEIVALIQKYTNVFIEYS